MSNYDVTRRGWGDFSVSDSIGVKLTSWLKSFFFNQELHHLLINIRIIGDIERNPAVEKPTRVFRRREWKEKVRKANASSPG